MGTKLGNIHILGASAEAVAPLLPGAVVGQWSERFVSAYSEDYHWGTVERKGKKLSGQLPEATVLTAAIFDSDVVSFEVYQAGKRLTAHLLNPYENINKLGNLQVFCETLGLSAEDEKRLKVLWKKGDAEEQMELTAALLGAPLYFDTEFLPKDPVHRDADKVDAWITDHPNPPKVKSVTRAEQVQEISDVVKPTQMGDHFFVLSAVSGMEEEKDIFGPYVQILVWYLISHDCLYRLGDDGLLELVVRRERPGATFCTTAFQHTDVKTEFRCVDENRIVELQITEDPFGWEVTWDSENLAVGETGNSDKYKNAFSHQPAYLRSSFLTPDGKTLFAVEWREGLQLIDTETGEICRELKSTAPFWGGCADGFGRFWVRTTSSTIEGYDENLQLISRHRLKGDIVDLRANTQGELMAYTYDCEYKSDDRTFRVYRIS